MISKQAYQKAAQKIGCDLATIKAVAEVESKGAGFNALAEPTILFERHVFHRLTQGKFSTSHPHISQTKAGGYGTYAEQHTRLQEATKLDRNAALQSASWGRFQIMGFNHKVAGFNTLQAFINAMYESEDQHLEAFVNFVMSEGLSPYLMNKDWAAFARRYNGPAYAKSQYDVKLARAYQKYSKEKS